MDRQRSFIIHSNDTLYFIQTNETCCLNRIINHQLFPMPLFRQLDRPVKLGYIPSHNHYSYPIPKLVFSDSIECFKWVIMPFRYSWSEHHQCFATVTKIDHLWHPSTTLTKINHLWHPLCTKHIIVSLG